MPRWIRLSTDSETVRNVCPAAKCNHGAWDLGQLRACWGQLTWIMVNARGPDRKGSSGASRDRAYVCRKAHAGYGFRRRPRRAEYISACIFASGVAGVAFRFSESGPFQEWVGSSRYCQCNHLNRSRILKVWNWLCYRVLKSASI